MWIRAYSFLEGEEYGGTREININLNHVATHEESDLFPSKTCIVTSYGEEIHIDVKYQDFKLLTPASSLMLKPSS